jgi:hypothetical protein
MATTFVPRPSIWPYRIWAKVKTVNHISLLRYILCRTECKYRLCCISYADRPLPRDCRLASVIIPLRPFVIRFAYSAQLMSARVHVISRTGLVFSGSTLSTPFKLLYFLLLASQTSSIYTWCTLFSTFGWQISYLRHSTFLPTYRL